MQAHIGMRGSETRIRAAIWSARAAALDLASDLLITQSAVPREFTFKYYATRFIEKGRALVALGERNENYIRSAQIFLDNGQWGLIKTFGAQDVRAIKTRQYQQFMDALAKKRPDLSPSTRNGIAATLRNVLKIARDDGVIDQVPSTPRTPHKDNPRPFFRFHPLVPNNRDVYKKVLATAQGMAKDKVVIRGVAVTDELYDFILFIVHSFVRPISTELYSIWHEDCEIANDPKRLLVTIRKGKTGFRIANTMPAAVTVYERIRLRYPNAKGNDYIFLPDYKNRTTAARIFQRQFNCLLEAAEIKHDPITNRDHTIYSLRHTAICMRIILSKGEVNIFNLAKNAGTSVEQIERFYARNLPLSAELAENLQSFGSG